MLGFVLVMLAHLGRTVGLADSDAWPAGSPSAGPTLAILIIVYGFAASALPVWLLLAPRDYLARS